MNISYLELNSSFVTVADYYIFSMKKRQIDVNDIGFVKIMNGIYQKLPGRTFKWYPFNYAVFYDKQGEYLFKYLLEFEEEYEWLEQVKKARNEKLEII